MTPVCIQSNDDASIHEAVRRLKAGGVVVIPTETVYGLAASTLDESALAQIFTLKGRPNDNPLIAHVLDQDQASTLVSGWDDRCRRLADRFWPGALTLIFHRRPEVPPVAAGGRDTLAVRCPSHPVARRVLTEFGGPVSAPSANRSNRISPTRASHVVDDYKSVSEAEDLLILDGGACDIGIESTVLDMTSSVPTVLRPGSITRNQLSEVLGPIESLHPTEQVHAPGTAARHYAPETPMILLNRNEIDSRSRAIAHRLGIVLIGSDPGVPGSHTIHVLPNDPLRFGEMLYSVLRELDEADVERILIERPPDIPVWDAVRDRLQRGSTHVSTTRSAGGGSSGGSS